MAQVQEEVVVIKLSKLVKDHTVSQEISNEELLIGLEAVVQELVGSSVIVEVEKA